MYHVGAWLAVNGEAIYNSRPWSVQNDTLSGDVWYTSDGKDEKVYATFLSWPKDNILRLGAVVLPDGAIITLLSTFEKLKVYTDKNDLHWIKRA